MSSVVGNVPGGWRRAAWWPALALLSAQLVNSVRETPQFAFFLIYLQEDLALSPIGISSVVAGAQITGMLSALMGGAITARLGSKWTLVLGFAIASLSSFVFHVHWFWGVALLWLLGGSAAGLVNVAGASYLTRLSAGGLGVLSALYALSMTVGGAVGSPIAGILIERYGFDLFGWYSLGLALLAVAVGALWLPDRRDHLARPPSLFSFWANIAPTVRRREVQLLSGLRGLPTFCYGTLHVLIPLLINEQSGNKVLVAAYGTATLVVASATQLLVGRAADRWGARGPSLLSFGLLIVSGLGLAVGAKSVTLLFVFGILGIAAAWALSTLMYVLVDDGIAKEDHPATFGWLHAVWSFSMIAGTLLGGWLVRVGPGLPFLVAGVVNVGSLVLVIVYYRRLATVKKFA